MTEGGSSAFGNFLRILEDLLSFFEATHQSIESSNSRIVEKYPKFLSKFALFALQMDDSTFRQTIIVQILIFAQSVTDPVGVEQKSVIKLSKEEVDAANKVHSQAAKLLLQISESAGTKPN